MKVLIETKKQELFKKAFPVNNDMSPEDKMNILKKINRLYPEMQENISEENEVKVENELLDKL